MNSHQISFDQRGSTRLRHFVLLNVSAAAQQRQQQQAYLTMQTAPLEMSMALNWRGGSPSAVHSSARSKLLCVMTRWLPPGADSRSVVPTCSRSSAQLSADVLFQSAAARNCQQICRSNVQQSATVSRHVVPTCSRRRAQLSAAAAVRWSCTLKKQAVTGVHDRGVCVCRPCPLRSVRFATYTATKSVATCKLLRSCNNLKVTGAAAVRPGSAWLSSCIVLLPCGC
jgi:hypothetical protein